MTWLFNPKSIRLVLLFYIFFQESVSFAVTIDVFGVDEIREKAILNAYAKNIERLNEDLLYQMRLPNASHKWQKIEALSRKKQRILNQMKKEYHLSYADFEPVIYPDGQGFITIEVIDAENPRGEQYVSKKKSYEKRTTLKNDIVSKMQEYESLGFQLIFDKKISPLISCPVHHCTFGFDEPALKPYLKLFNEAAISEKEKIIEIMNKDKNPERQATAAFLIAHFKEKEEILNLLLPHINSPHAIVRNNVLRVIGEVLQKKNVTLPSVAPFLSLLDSPVLTDRNKSLLILEQLILTEKNKETLILEGKRELLTLLKLKQPNNHETTYAILKKISGKQFGEYDIEAWSKWFDEAKARITSKT